MVDIFRSVPENQKSFALGIQWLIVRALGTIPAAPIIGGIIDYSCVLWQDDCGEIGSCYAYDNKKMGMFSDYCTELCGWTISHTLTLTAFGITIIVMTDCVWCIVHLILP